MKYLYIAIILISYTFSGCNNSQDTERKVSSDKEVPNNSEQNVTEIKLLKRVAISYFDNTSNNSEYVDLSKGIADMLITDMSKVKEVKIVEREKLENLLEEIKLNNASYFDPETAQKLGRGLGAQSILTGAYIILKDEIRIDARLIDVESGTIQLAEEVTGSLSDFFSLHKQLTALLAKSLELKFNPSTSEVFEEGEIVSLNQVNQYAKAVHLIDEGMDEESAEILEGIEGDFTYANKQLQEVRAFIDDASAQREKYMVKLSTKYKNEFDFTKDVGKQYYQIWTHNPTNQKLLYEIGELILSHSEVDFSQKLVEGQNWALGEMLLFNKIMYFVYTSKHVDLVEVGQQFIKDYPTSMYFSMVSGSLTQSLNALKKIERDREKYEDILIKIKSGYFDKLSCKEMPGYYKHKGMSDSERFFMLSSLYKEVIYLNKLYVSKCDLSKSDKQMYYNQIGTIYNVYLKDFKRAAYYYRKSIEADPDSDLAISLQLQIDMINPMGI
jgi:TolB-like protein